MNPDSGIQPVVDGADYTDTPIRLLKVITSYFSGGTERQVLNLIRRLDRSEFDLQSACLRKGGDILKEFEHMEFPITEFRIKNLYSAGTMMQQLRFAGFLRKQRVQILHSYNFYSNVFAIPAAKLAGIPVILASIRDQGVYLTPAQKKVQKWICGLADRILVNAESIREWLLEQGYAENKIVVIKNGIDLSRFDKVRGESGIRAELGIPENVPVILMLSRLNAQKGVDDFIDAAAIVNKSHPDIRFLIVGTKLRLVDGVYIEDTPYMEGLKSRAKSCGIGDRVILAGVRKDVPEVLAEADISVLPSYSEGLSNTLLESMAAGVPVVTTHVGGNPELIKDGINGFLVPVKSPQLLAEAMVRILDNPELARQLSIQARKMAAENYSLERMARDTQNLYRAELGAATLQGLGK